MQLNPVKGIFLVVFIAFLATVAEAEDEQEKSAQKMIDFSFANYEDGGKKKWDVSAGVADFFTETVKMQNIVGNMYGESDNFRLTADQGVYNKVIGSMHLQDNVVGTSESGVKMVTNSLDWDSKKGLITTEDPITIAKESMNTSGTGVVADQNLKIMTLQKDVTVNMAREGEGGTKTTVITCDGPLDIDYSQQMAIFNDNVVATDEQGKMYADKMTVYFDMETKKIKKVICSGDVQMQQEENSAYGQTVTYDAVEQKAQVTGRPCLIFYTKQKDDEEETGEGEDDEGGASFAPFGN